MSHILGRTTSAQQPIAAAGDGCYIIDADGKRYLDGSGGAAVSCLGHNDPEIQQAIKAQLEQLEFAHTGFFTSEPAEKLADLLIANAPDGISHVYLVSGGSEAIESALKLARQYFVELGKPGKKHIIARRQSYHGNTLGALASGGNEWRRAQFKPLLIETSHIAPCYAYRDRREDETEFEYGQRVANELEAEILRLGPENVMAFLAEPVVGATAGAVPPVPGYFARIREICDRHEVLLILDEVMCGMGRTGSLFASEQEDVRPDIITIAKGLGAGYQPIGAMLCSQSIYDAIANGSGIFQHGHTYLGHPIAAAASHAVVSAIIARGLLGRVGEQGVKLMSALQDEFGQHPHVGDIRGRGLFLALEFVRNRDTKQVFDTAQKIAATLRREAFAAGLICYPMSGTIDGKTGDHVLLAPPFIISDEQIDELVSKLATAVDRSLP